MSKYDYVIIVLKGAIMSNKLFLEIYDMCFEEKKATKDRIAQLESAIKRLKEEG